MRAKLLFFILAVFLLSGCSQSPVEEFLRLPELPREFVEFNDQLNAIRAGGAEPAAPISGFNRQSVQLMDLDNDGVEEGIAFAAKKGEAERAIMYVFKKQGDSYQILGEIEGPGNLIESVTYADLMGNGNYEIIVGWGLVDNSARTLTAYQISEDGMEKLLEVPYLNYIQADMEGNGVLDLGVVMPDEKNNAPRLALFVSTMGELRFRTSVALSQGISQIKKISTGYAADGVPAVFVDSLHNSKNMVTDIVIMKNGKLINAIVSDETGISDATLRNYQINCEDADGDGIIEVPVPAPFLDYDEESSATPLYGITWKKFNKVGKLSDALYTYHDYSDNWHVMLPLKWKGKITAERISDERGVAFYSIGSQGKKNLLFSVYVLTGESRYAKAASAGRFQLAEWQNIVYAGEINKNSYSGISITEESLKDMFQWHAAEWNSGETVS